MSKKILIIDDSPFVAVQIEEMVSEVGYDVISARNGTEGVAMYHDETPDIVILDIVMPGIDGIETARLLFEADPDANIIMLSSLFDEETMREVKELGVSCLLPKPVEKEQLFQKLGEFDRNK